MFLLSPSNAPIEPATDCSTERTTGTSTHDGLIGRVDDQYNRGTSFLFYPFVLRNIIRVSFWMDPMQLRHTRSISEFMVCLFLTQILGGSDKNAISFNKWCFIMGVKNAVIVELEIGGENKYELFVRLWVWVQSDVHLVKREFLLFSDALFWVN
jgi:hypothetical protein